MGLSQNCSVFHEILIENQVRQKQVLKPDIAYTVTQLLSGVIKNGTGRRARIMGLKRPAAGKTGTTNDFADAWFVGYVPNMAVGVWVGFDDQQKSAETHCSYNYIHHPQQVHVF